MEAKIDKIVNGNKKLPRCVAVYDKLFEMIKEGEFSKLTQLPSEPELAKMMGVSRMTLRQALSLFQEDGIIKNIRGKGNFIIRDGVKLERGLENLENPIYSSLESKITGVDIEFKLETPTDYTDKVLGRRSPVVIFVDRWYKFEESVIAYTLSMIPVETISEEKIELADKKQLLNFLEKTIYEKSCHSSIKISFSEAGNFSSMKSISKKGKFYLLGESIYIKSQYPVVYNKHYIPIENGQIIVERKRK